MQHLGKQPKGVIPLGGYERRLEVTADMVRDKTPREHFAITSEPHRGEAEDQLACPASEEFGLDALCAHSTE